MDLAFVTGPWAPDARVALGSVPDPHRVVDAGFRRVVVLVPDHQLRDRGHGDLLVRYRQLGLDVLHEPIEDFQPGTVEQLERIVRYIESAVEDGAPVLVHCMGGRGRSGMAVAAWVVSRGLSGAQAIDAVRTARPGAIETPEQEQRVRGLS